MPANMLHKEEDFLVGKRNGHKRGKVELGVHIESDGRRALLRRIKFGKSRFKKSSLLSSIMLTDQNHIELVGEAILAREKAVTKEDTSTKYGAAVLCGGLFYQGASVYSWTSASNIHAEMAAIVHAFAHGHKIIDALAIVSTKERFELPCGGCRQQLYQFMTEVTGKFPILCAKPNGEYQVKTIEQLLPEPWHP